MDVREGGSAINIGIVGKVKRFVNECLICNLPKLLTGMHCVRQYLYTSDSMIDLSMMW